MVLWSIRVRCKFLSMTFRALCGLVPAQLSVPSLPVDRSLKDIRAEVVNGRVMGRQIPGQ